MENWVQIRVNSTPERSFIISFADVGLAGANKGGPFTWIGTRTDNPVLVHASYLPPRRYGRRPHNMFNLLVSSARSHGVVADRRDLTFYDTKALTELD